MINLYYSYIYIYVYIYISKSSPWQTTRHAMQLSALNCAQVGNPWFLDGFRGYGTNGTNILATKWDYRPS